MSDYVLLNSVRTIPDGPNKLCCVSDDGVTWFGPKVFKGLVKTAGGDQRFDVRNIGEKERYFWKYAREVRLEAIYLDNVTGRVGCDKIDMVNDDDSITLANEWGDVVEYGIWKFLTPNLFKQTVVPNENTSN